MKLTKKRITQIIKEEVEAAREEIAEIAIDANPGPEVDVKDELEELSDEEKKAVLGALKEIDLLEVVKTTLSEQKK